jgi:hypothetical protein
MRFLRRRNPASRAKRETILLLNTTQCWRDRVKALKAAQDSASGKDANGASKEGRV